MSPLLQTSVILNARCSMLTIFMHTLDINKDRKVHFIATDSIDSLSLLQELCVPTKIFAYLKLQACCSFQFQVNSLSG